MFISQANNNYTIHHKNYQQLQISAVQQSEKYSKPKITVQKLSATKMAQRTIFSSLTILVVVVISSTISSPVTSRRDAPEGLILMGGTSTKELYITAPEITGDFTNSLVIGCPHRFQMSLAAVETTEEVSIIDNYFNSTQGNSSDAVWTSAMARVGMIPAHWASNGLRITEFPAVIQGPWPSGAGSSPTYANYNCVTIQRVCVRPPGSPTTGCFPAQTQFNYSPCDVQRRYICQKSI